MRRSFGLIATAMTIVILLPRFAMSAPPRGLITAVPEAVIVFWTDFLSFFGLLGTILYVQKTFIFLGTFLILVGAFFPSRTLDKLSGTETIVKIPYTHLSIKGHLRALLITTGSVILLLTLIFGFIHPELSSLIYEFG
jgi:hypothetical protein